VEFIMNSSNAKTLLVVLIVLVVGVLAWNAMRMPDQRTSGERIGDAVDTLPQGVDEAAEELGDRTPAERMGDAVDDMGENVSR
jgi:hypothetical protein